MSRRHGRAVTFEDFCERVRQHYLGQFRAFVRQQREASETSASEVKIRLNGEGGPFRQLICADLIRGDPPQVVALDADKVLEFEPIHTSVGWAKLTVEHLRWDDVLVLHDARKPLKAIDRWFDRWFDPEGKRFDEEAEFSDTIHSLTVAPQRVSVDFGSAPARALVELLRLIEKQGARNIRINSERAEAR